MRRYETIVIIDPDISEDDRTSLFNRIKEIIPQQDGVLIREDPWGNKKLAYEIKKKPRGYYVRYDYCGMGPVVDEIERFFKIDDRILKYLTVQLAEEADADQILAEVAAEDITKEAETAAAEEAGETAAQEPVTSEAPAQEEAVTEEAAESATEEASTEAASTEAASTEEASTEEASTEEASTEEAAEPATEEASEKE